MMLRLQEQGCHNINFVTPSHVAVQILEALPIAIEHGLRVPLVYNTSSYDSLEVLRLLDGVVDIYMPDVKSGMWKMQSGISGPKIIRSVRGRRSRKCIVRSAT